MQILPSFAHSLSSYSFTVNGLEVIDYRFSFRWSERIKAWHMDVETLAGEKLVSGIRLVNGWQLLRRHRGKAGVPPGGLILVDTSGRKVDPEKQSDIGDAVNGGRLSLVYVPLEEHNDINAEVASRGRSLKVVVDE